MFYDNMDIFQKTNKLEIKVAGLNIAKYNTLTYKLLTLSKQKNYLKL